MKIFYTIVVNTHLFLNKIIFLKAKRLKQINHEICNQWLEQKHTAFISSPDYKRTRIVQSLQGVLALLFQAMWHRL